MYRTKQSVYFELESSAVYALGHYLDHVERTDPARYHFRKPYKCPRCHALCHAPKIHTHLHEGLLDVVIRIARQ